jgi:hypothetical protein
MRDRLRGVLAIGLSLLIVLAVSSCSSSPSASGSSTPTPSASIAATVTARALYAGYAKDKAASDTLYKGKLLEVSGVVERVGTDPILNAPEIMLVAGSAKQGPGVDCIIDARYSQQAGKVRPGQTVTVAGTCDGFAVNVLLLHCRLLGDGH